MRDLREPTVHSDPTREPWLTLLTGDNVDLLPDQTRALLRDLVEPPAARCGGIRMLVVARSRVAGVAALSGTVATARDGAAEMRVGRAYGRPDALAALGTALGRYLSDLSRFGEVPGIVWEPDARGPEDRLVAALAVHGVVASVDPGIACRPG